MTNKNNNLILEDEKDEKLSTAIKEIEKLYGKGSVMFLGQGLQLKIDTISTGSLLLDSAIGVGGYPKGRIIEIFGPESSGKTTLALHAIAQCQIAGGTAAFIDAEHALDPNYAKKIGVNLDNLIVAQPDSGEQGLDILETLVKSEVVDLVIVDSVAALVPKAELEGEMSDVTIGAHARLMSKALRKLNGIISKTNSVVIFINQIREKVGVIFGNPEITTGGRALRFYASIRLEVRKSETLQNNGVAHANRVKIKVVKNKVAAPFRSVLLDIYYQSGIDQVFEMIDLGVMYNIIDKAGVWYSYNNNKIGQGKEKTREYLINNPDILLDIKNQILEKIIF